MPIIRQIESITDEFCTTSNDTQRNDVPATYSTSVKFVSLGNSLPVKRISAVWALP